MLLYHARHEGDEVGVSLVTVVDEVARGHEIADAGVKVRHRPLHSAELERSENGGFLLLDRVSVSDDVAHGLSSWSVVVTKKEEILEEMRLNNQMSSH